MTYCFGILIVIRPKDETFTNKYLSTRQLLLFFFIPPIIIVETSSSTGDSAGNGGDTTVADFITQTDAYGNSIRRPEQVSDLDSGGSSSSTSSEQGALNSSKPKAKLLQRWFCCFVGGRPDNFADEIDESAHQNPVKNPSAIAAAEMGEAGGRKGSAGLARSLPQKLPNIPALPEEHKRKKCLVLDLDETLVHSSLREEESAHMVIPVNIDNAIHNVFVIKRPGVDMFLKRMGEKYEIIVYTASLSKYADPLLDRLDTYKVISKRLFRENCVFHEGHFVKDLSLLNRELHNVIIVDNSPMSYTFHPENAIDCGSFIDDPSDVEMWMIGDFLAGIADCNDVRDFCKNWRDWCAKNPSTVPRDKL